MKDLTMYNAMMKGYITQKMFKQAIDIFNRVKNPNEVSTILLFNACARLQTKEALDLVKEVSLKIPKSFYSNPHCLTSLIDALMKCNDIQEAESVFSRLTTKTQSMYGAMMKGYAKHRMCSKVIDMFQQIKQPDEVNVGLLFNACAQLGTDEALAMVKRISSNMPSSFYSSALMLASLIDALMKCGDVKSAEAVFLRKTIDDLSLYGALMSGYVNNQMPFQAIELFEEVTRKGLLLVEGHQRTNNDIVESNQIIYLTVINALADHADLSTAESIVKQIPTSSLAHPHIRNALTHMWGKVGSINKAEELFQSMQQPDHIGYTTMVHAYGLNGMSRQAVDLYDRMPKEYIDQKANVSVLNACSHSGLIDEARRIFDNISQPTPQVYATMVDCLSRAGLFDQAKGIIDRFEETSTPSLSMYMALLSGCRNCQNSHLAEEVHNRMIKHFPEAQDSMTAAAVLLANTVASSGDLDKASHVRMRLNGPDVKKTVGLSWTTVNGQFYRFRAHDQSHPRSAEIHAEVSRMMDEAVQHGHQYNASWVTRALKSGETIASVLGGHSEKLAIAWNFVENRKTTRIQIAKKTFECAVIAMP